MSTLLERADCQKGKREPGGWGSVNHRWWIDPFGAAHCSRCERKLSVDATKRAGIRARASQEQSK